VVHDDGQVAMVAPVRDLGDADGQQVVEAILNRAGARAPTASVRTVRRAGSWACPDYADLVIVAATPIGINLVVRQGGQPKPPPGPVRGGPGVIRLRVGGRPVPKVSYRCLRRGQHRRVA
jgi:hypothetical protein